MDDMKRDLKNEGNIERGRILLYIAELLQKENLISENEKIEMIENLKLFKDCCN